MIQTQQPPLETLKQYKGQWIAFLPKTTDIIAHDESYLKMVKKADKTGKDFIIRYVHPYDIPNI
jgi:hypothetical protein